MTRKSHKMFQVIFATLICASFLHLHQCAKILGVFPNNGYSQYILGSALMKGLAAKGHEVTVISPFAQKAQVPNYKDVTTASVRKFHENNNLFDLESMNAFHNIMVAYDDFSIPLTENILNDTKVQELLHSKATFDLVICEVFLNEAHMGFAHHYQAPLVLFSSLGSTEWSNHLVANPAPFSHVPILFSGFNDRMNFWQRLGNTALGLFDTIYKHTFIFPKQSHILQKYFPDAPDIKDLMYNASLILLNSNVAMNAPVPHVPSMVEIGGFHVSPKKLPKDLQDFLDSARYGFIFFSMGSNLRSTVLPKEKRGIILNVLSKLKQKVLWKWEDENLPEKPDNVKIGKWFPQQDILAHPNIRAFISHSGLLSTTEAVYNGVPMVCIPIFGDQKMNAEIAVSSGYAVKVPYSDVTEEKLTWALNEILTNTSYKDTAQRRSRILRDQPLKPMDNAIFWIEYVMRHRGASHLRSAALDLYWYQYLLLDVFTFVLVVLISILVLFKILLWSIFEVTKVKNIPKEKKL